MKEAQTEKKKPPYGIWKNFVFATKLLWEWDKAIIFYILGNIPIIVLLPLCQVYLPKIIVQGVEIKVPPIDLIQSILAIGAASITLTILQKVIAAKMRLHNEKVMQKLNLLVLSKSMHTDYENIDKPDTQVLIQKSLDIVYGGEENGIQAILVLLVTILANILGFTVYAGILSKLNPLITILIFVISFASYFFMIYVNKWIYKNKDNWLKLDLKLAYLTYKSASFDVAKDIRLYHMKDWFFGTFAKFMKKRIQWTIKMQLFYYANNALDSSVAFLRDGVAYAYLIYLIWKGSISVSDFVLYFGVIGGFSIWCRQIIAKIVSLNQMNYRICEFRSFLELKDKMNREKGIPLPPKEMPCEIRLENVCYQYQGEEKNTIKNIDLTVHPREKIAIVGSNGAGKTTLIKLICGLYTPTSGSITINGHNLNDYNRDELYQLFSPVFQDIYILPISVEKNITLCGKEKIDTDRLKKCLALSGFDKVAEKLPHGLDTLLVNDMDKEAVQLSGGEEQKLILARALYKNAPIMILDEPTAALDPIAENAMYLKYNELAEQSTSFFISHRLASTRFCDRIILLEHGKILETGTHEELLQLGGRYKEMFEIQAKYYRESEGRELQDA